MAASRISLATNAALWLASVIAGAVLFWLMQVLSGGPTIPDFIGEQIADAGRDPAMFAPAIGWTVHLAVSLSYALLFGVIIALLAARRLPPQVAISFAIMLVLGWITTMVAPPAISVTISVLAGQGWPSELFPLNTELGLPFWNHVAFFLLSWVIQGLASSGLSREARASVPDGRPGAGRPSDR